MIKIKIKPLSVNNAWQGRRFKTREYKIYEKAMLSLLPPRIDIPDPPIIAHYEFGVSNRGSDWDNPIKPCQDILQKKYHFNDSGIYTGIVNKVIVPKGEEYIKIKFEKKQ